jgi:hypothetical protein
MVHKDIYIYVCIYNYIYIHNTVYKIHIYIVIIIRFKKQHITVAYCGTTWLGSPSWLKKPSPFKFYKLSMERSQGLLRFSHNILMTCWAACGDSSWPSSGNSGNSISMSSHQGDEMSTELLKVIINNEARANPWIMRNCVDFRCKSHSHSRNMICLSYTL